MRYIINLFTDILKGKPATLRSSKWESVRKNHLINQPSCRACDGKENLQVHHIKPFHLFPELELNPSNLITLCEHPDKECHLILGHKGNFKNYNATVLEDVKKYRIEHLLV